MINLTRPDDVCMYVCLTSLIRFTAAAVTGSLV